MLEQHVWIDGPDGPDYHCPVCGVSRAEDYVNKSCEDILRERAEMKPYLLEMFVQQQRMNWGCWLNAPKVVTMTRGEWYAKRFSEWLKGIWIYKNIP